MKTQFNIKLIVSLAGKVLLCTILLLPITGFTGKTAEKTILPVIKETAFATKFAPLWERAKAYTLEMAEAMPENQYGYKPNAEVRTFGEQMIHVGQAIGMLSAGLLKGEKNPFEDVSKIKTKKEIISMLNKSFDYMSATVAAIPEEELSKMVNVDFLKTELSKEEIVYFIRDHTTHHRSQALVYLRDKGIKAPQYRGW